MIAIRTINYAIPPDGHFWRWSERCDAIEWSDGRTLALWPEVHAVLEFTGRPGGLPPLGALLLVLAASRDEWAVQRAINHVSFSRALGISDDAAIPPDLADVLITGLDHIHALPKDLRSSLAAKCHLISMMFGGGPYSLAPADSEWVLRDLAVLGPDSFGKEKPEMNAKARFFRDLRALRTGLNRHDPAHLENLLRTGIEQAELREPSLPEEIPRDVETRRLLDELIRTGGEAGAAAAVAKRAIAMMNFPGSFGAPRDLPVGGISDITNRGTVDRLLPGELAWDDLVLAARLVHNEALYFRREIPPQHVAVSHTVLLDRSLRLWGTARVFSLGVALGLWHHPALNAAGETFECAAASPDGFSYLDLDTPAGVQAALGVLVPAASPMNFLTHWWDAARIIDDPAIPDLSFVTAREHLDETATKSLLGGIAGWIHERHGRFQVIAVDRLGGLEMHAWSPGGNRTLFRGEIDLAEILKPSDEKTASEQATPPPLRKQPDLLPKLLPIYSLDHLPFLFPAVPQAAAYLPEHGIGVSLDHRLMSWPKPGWGGCELVSEVPGRQQWLGQDDDGSIIVIASAEQAGDPVRAFRFDGEALIEIEIATSLHAFPRHAAVSGGAILLAYAGKVEAISLASGRRVAEEDLATVPASPVLIYDGNRLFVHDSGKKASLAVDGWSFRDASWPRMISPDQVSIDGGELRVMCGKQSYRFAKERKWLPDEPRGQRFHSFAETSFQPAGEVTMKVARPLGHFEIWLDSRGLLHLKNTLHPAEDIWSILLSTETSSVWSQRSGLCSDDERLLRPGTKLSNELRARVLQELKNTIRATPRLMP